MSRIAASKLWEALPGRVLLDVRTPAEYAHGHIPAALSLPLFSDAERAEVGTLYKQQSPQIAFLRGLEFAGQKLRHYVEEAYRLAPGAEVIVHCWRGGQRSGSMGWLLAGAGMQVQTLEGGYKAYRQVVLHELAFSPGEMLILGGPTGSGKTHILAALQRLGAQVIDLEGLAHHKGSSFGALGELPQPSVEQFENLLHDRWRQLHPAQPIWLEDESRAIGRVYIPDPFWRRMMAARLIVVDMPFEWRIQNLVEDYASFPPQMLREAFTRITKRLGGQHVQAALAALDANDYASAAAIALRYYDKTYQYGVAQRAEAQVTRLQAADRDPAVIAQQLYELINTR